MGKDHSKKYFLVSILFVLFVLTINYATLHEMKERGTLGDLFGISNAIFSGVGICGLVYTLILQQKSLSAFGESIVASNSQAEYSKKAYKLQAMTSALESIEKQISLAQDARQKSQTAISLENDKKAIQREIKIMIEEILK